MWAHACMCGVLEVYLMDLGAWGPPTEPLLYVSTSPTRVSVCVDMPPTRVSVCV